MRKLLLLIVIFVVAAKISLAPTFAASTIEIEDVSQKDAALGIMKYFIKNEGIISKINTYSFSVTNTNKNFKNELWYGTPLWLSSKSKINVNISQKGKNAVMSLSGNTYGMNRNRQYVLYFTKSQEMVMLNRMKKLITGYYTYGFSYEYKYNHLLITEVNHFNSYEKGIKKNTRITALDNVPVSKIPQSEITKKLVDLKNEKVLNLTIRENTNSPSRHIVLVSSFVNPCEDL